MDIDQKEKPDQKKQDMPWPKKLGKLADFVIMALGAFVAILLLLCLLFGHLSYLGNR